MSSLKKKSTKALLWDLSGSVGTNSIGLGVSIILARLLNPEQFGVVGMALVFISLSQSFVNFGFNSALIQSQENKSTTYSSVFFFNVTIGLFFLVIFQFFAPIIANFYEIDSIENLVRWLSLMFLFNSLSLVQEAILQKELKFKELNLRLLISGFVGGILGICFAYYGYGVYALVYQNLSASMISTILLWNAASWRPKLEFSIKELGKLMSFSTYVFSLNLIYTFITKVNIFLIGKIFSASVLGFYTRAESLSSRVSVLISRSLNKVFFPVLSKYQNDSNNFQKVFLQIAANASFAIFLISGIVMLSAEIIIITLLGEKWRQSIEIFEILMFMMFSRPLNAIILNALLAYGKAKENFWFGLLRCCLWILPILVAMRNGFMYFLYCTVIIAYINAFINNLVLHYFCNISLKLQFRAIHSFTLYFSLSIITVWFCQIDVSSMLINAFLKNCLFIFIYLLLILLMDRKFLLNLLLNFTSLYKKGLITN